MKPTIVHPQTVLIRPPDSIYQAGGAVENGSFRGQWHFSYAEYNERDFSHFGSLRVFNDDTLSPGATFPPQQHRNIELVTYCAAGVFRHADERGRGGVLMPGWVQHCTVGRGMSHSQINDSADEPMRFIQMWFLPSETDLEPAIQQKPVARSERTNLLLPLVGGDSPEALPIVADACVYSSFLQTGHRLAHTLPGGHGAYVYVVDGGPVRLDGEMLPRLGAAKIIGGGSQIDIMATADAEMLVVEVPLAVRNRAGY
ncbi:MAG: pirin family protein [Thermoleophilia bacterium]